MITTQDMIKKGKGKIEEKVRVPVLLLVRLRPNTSKKICPVNAISTPCSSFF
jgi:hypothetical protein